jgi:HEAT repeat protein
MEWLAGELGGFMADRIFLSLSILILSLLGLAVFFAVLTFFLRLRNERETRTWERLSKTWDPLLLDALSDPERLQAIWEEVKDEHQILFLEFVLQYAQRLGGSERETLKRAAEPFLPKMLPLLSHRQVGVRARAVQTLGVLGLPAFAEEVKEAVDDESPFVGALAARLLAHEGGGDIAEELCRRLSRFKNFRNWYLVDLVVALGPSAIPTIRETMVDTECPLQIRSVAAHSLSVLGDLASADPAGRLALEEEDPALLTSLMRLLGQVGTDEHAPAARAHIDSDEFFLRAAAIRALSELGGEEDLPLLVEKLSDPSAWVRMAAARGVYRIGGREALRVLGTSEDPARVLFRQVLGEEASP